MTAAPGTTGPRRLAEVAQRALEQEGAANELRLAQVRLLCHGIASAAGLVLWLTGRRATGDLLSKLGMLALVGLVLVLVRRSYRPWFRFAIPVVDAATVGYLLWLRVEAAPGDIGVHATVAAIGIFFAATGAMRLDRASALWTIGLATGVTLWLSGSALGSALPFVVASLIGVGLLAMWQSAILERLARGEQGRALMRRLLPRTVVDQAYSNPEAMVAAPVAVTVTVLVTDLRGFTALSEKLAPAQVVELLNELHSAAADLVVSRGGSVDKFMGDGMLAVFGAPDPLEDHSVRALAAALELREAVRAINARHPDRPPLKLGAGLHTGTVVSGIIGGGTKAEFTVIGDTVNLASRLEAMTKELGVDILLSAETARLSGAGPFRDLGEVAVRGRDQGLRVCTPAADLALPRLEPVDRPEISAVSWR